MVTALLFEIVVGDNKVVEQIISFLVENIELISGIVIGSTIIGVYHRFFGQRGLRKSYERLIFEKDNQIETLKALVSERLEKVHVEKIEDKGFIRGLKKYFKKNNKN